MHEIFIERAGHRGNWKWLVRNPDRRQSGGVARPDAEAAYRRAVRFVPAGAAHRVVVNGREIGEFTCTYEGDLTHDNDA